MWSVLLCFLTRQVIFIFTLFTVNQLYGQLKWDGEASDGLWSTALNWIGDQIPGSNDDVLLDHSIITTDYTITLPSGNSLTVVRSLVIAPIPGKKIEVILPVGNTAVPAFTANRPGYGLEIHEGGTFRNSSGASSGTPVEIADSIKIYNGGRFLHNTARAHAANVAVLSRAPGTELGIFEFDVPGGAGYTVSIAGRVYGSMVLSATAAGGAKSYTSTGMTAIHVNGHLKINSGANYSLNFNSPFTVHGDFIHLGNILDLSAGMHSNQLVLLRDMNVLGTVTESGTGAPAIEWKGSSNQNISTTGTISQSVTCRLINPAGITLLTPFSVSHRLEFVAGKIRTSPVNILVIRDDAVCSGSSMNSFVEGPVRKFGDDDFEFPVGRQNDYAPVTISGTGGDPGDSFEAEYLYGNPSLIFGSAKEDPPIVRISELEYWKLERISGTVAKRVTLSVRTYSQATLLEKLVVSRWDIPGSIWKSEGNTSYNGISMGTITSGDVQSFGVFTLGSTVANQNPLPTSIYKFDIFGDGQDVIMDVNIRADGPVGNLELYRSQNNKDFTRIQNVYIGNTKRTFRLVDPVSNGGIYFYQARLWGINGELIYVDTRQVLVRSEKATRIASALMAGGYCKVKLEAIGNGIITLQVFNAEGKQITFVTEKVTRGKNNLSIDFYRLPAGLYYVTGIWNDRRMNVKPVIKM